MKAPRLREVRDNRALSQRDLAKLAGVAPGTIVRLEAGQDSYQVSIRKLAAALGVAPAELTGASHALADRVIESFSENAIDWDADKVKVQLVTSDEPSLDGDDMTWTTKTRTAELLDESKGE